LVKYRIEVEPHGGLAAAVGAFSAFAVDGLELALVYQFADL